MIKMDYKIWHARNKRHHQEHNLKVFSNKCGEYICLFGCLVIYDYFMIIIILCSYFYQIKTTHRVLYVILRHNSIETNKVIIVQKYHINTCALMRRYYLFLIYLEWF
jgi:hypothetical protein